MSKINSQVPPGLKAEFEMSGYPIIFSANLIKRVSRSSPEAVDLISHSVDGKY
jgi:hypothetical protein